MTRTTFLAIAALLSVAGCASRSVPLAQSTPVPSERVQYHDHPSPAATFVVIVDTAWARPFVRQQIVMDGLDIALLEKGESVTFKVAAGEHLLGSKFPSVLDPKLRTVSVTAEVGRTYYFRMGIEASGTATFTRAMSADN